MARVDQARPANKEEGRIAWQKAQQFLKAAHSEKESGRWDAVGLNAIHAGICASDAVLINIGAERVALSNVPNSTDHYSFGRCYV